VMPTTMPSDLESWASILASVATIVAAFVAIWGINSWRREHIGKRRAELAEEMLVRVLEARDAIKYIRNPVIPHGKLFHREPTPGETPEQKDARDWKNAANVRWSQKAKVFSRLFASRHRFQALFGAEAAKPIEDIPIILLEISSAGGELLRLSEMPILSGEKLDKHNESVERNRRIFLLGTGADPDPIEDKMAKIVEKIERTCKPAIMVRDKPNGIWAWVSSTIEKTYKQIDGKRWKR